MRRALPQFQALTLSFDGIAHRIVSQASLTEPFDPKDAPCEPPKVLNVAALWDTGASGSVITPRVVAELGLAPVGKSMMRHGGGESQQDNYLVNLYLPNGVGFAGVIVTEMDKLTDDFDLIIGMNIMGVGDLSLTNYQGKTCFSFRLPSQGRVDYVEEHNAKVRRSMKPNDHCFCGSGNKFKKCCGARG